MAHSRRVQPSHFFKIILPSTLQDRKLRLPEKFVKKFGDELSAVAKLTVPNGCVWQVGLAKDGSKIWFQDGWHEFVEYHSIAAGYFLVFKYEKSSNFHVLIFDLSAFEIQYPYNGEEREKGKQNSVSQDEMEEEDSVRMMDFTTRIPSFSFLKNKGSSECPSKGSFSKMYSSLMQQNHDKCSFGTALEINWNQKCNMSPERSKFKHSHEMPSKRCKIEEIVEINESDDVDESRRGEINNNENSQGSLLCKRHLNRNAGNLHAWSLLPHDMGTKIDRTKFRKIGHDWEDECLREVVFNESELKKAAHKFGVHYSDEVNNRINPDQEDLSVVLEDMGISFARKCKPFADEERKRIINAARLLKPKSPSFAVFLRLSEIKRNCLYVPTKFYRRYLVRDTKYIKIQDSNGSEWPVQIKWPRHGCFIQEGWAAFSKDKNLDIGDICFFQLISTNEAHMNVSVIYASKKKM